MKQKRIIPKAARQRGLGLHGGLLALRSLQAAGFYGFAPHTHTHTLSPFGFWVMLCASG